ncbi:hypothetical protein GAPWK_1645 [Gilliamella apicola]|nr:hypothetical protein GAPWK_1645 [Gilliamella apicola]PXV90956.1 hypothetical protein C7392_11255 [Gilliamella apicola]
MGNNQVINNAINAVNKAVYILENEELTVVGFYHRLAIKTYN